MSAFGAVILGAEGLRLSPEEVSFFREVRPFGFIMFARNIETPDQVRALCAEMRDAAGHDAPILIDQEGGRVQRLRGPIWRDWLPPMEQVALAGHHAEEAMYARYRIIAHELHALGIDANCAPLVDIAVQETHPFLKNRCYGTDLDTVTSVGRAVADGLLDGGVLPVVKHIPGHGRARVDSHLDLPRVDADQAVLREMDFAPFAAMADLPLGMTAHLVYSAFDDAPATISPTMMQVIRDEIGFSGLIMTDDISMKALQGDLGSLSARSIEAGCDVVLHCNGDMQEMRAVASAAGVLKGSGLERATRALKCRTVPKAADIPALEARLTELLAAGARA